jgi:hypothetical protein
VAGGIGNAVSGLEIGLGNAVGGVASGIGSAVGGLETGAGNVIHDIGSGIHNILSPDGQIITQQPAQPDVPPAAVQQCGQITTSPNSCPQDQGAPTKVASSGSNFVPLAADFSAFGR